MKHRIPELISKVVEDARNDRVSLTVSGNIKISASPASEALGQVVQALQIFVNISNGENAALKTAPDEIQEKAQSLISGTKNLIGMINQMIGLKPEEVAEKEEVVEKEEVKEEPEKKPVEEEEEG